MGAEAGFTRQVNFHFMSDELSFEELTQAIVRAMRGNSAQESQSRQEPKNPAAEDSVEIPEEFLGDDFPVGDLDEFQEENEPDLAMYDEDDPQESGFRSFTDEIDDDQIVPVSPESILEAMLFVGNPSNTPIAPEILSNLMRGVSVDEISGLVDELNEKYEKAGAPWEIVWFEEEGGYFMRLRESFAPLRENFYGKIRQAKLSQGAIDVLAIVAYEQPVSLDEINQTRGASSANILANLVKRQLLRTQKMRQGTKFVTVYYTTDRFLKLFELESISDLPQSEDLDRE